MNSKMERVATPLPFRSETAKLALLERRSRPRPAGSAAVCNQEPPAKQESSPRLLGPIRLPIPPAFTERGAEAQAALLAAYPEASVEEKIIHQLVCDEIVLAASIKDSLAQLTAQLGAVIDDPKSLLLLTKTLKELMAIYATISKRIAGGLATGANLRAQRDFLQTHTGRAQR